MVFTNIGKCREWHAKHEKAKEERKPLNGSFSSRGKARGWDVHLSSRIRPSVLWHRRQASTMFADDN